MLNIGLVGCGTHANWAVIPAIKGASDKMRLAAVADVNPQNLARVTDSGVAKFSDHKAMIAGAKLDAVYVATLANTHAAISIDAMNAGLHVVCEKPMAMTADECRSMLDVSRRTRRVVAVNFETRYHADHVKIREWIDAGHLGTIEAIHLQNFWDGHKVEGEIGARRKRLCDLAGALDCGIHKADKARYFVGGKWKSIEARGRWFGEDTKQPPHIAVLAELDNNILVTLNASFSYTAYIPHRAYSDVLTIVGTRGVVNHFHDRLGKSAVQLHSADLVTQIESGDTGHANVMVSMLRDFADACGGKTPPPQLALVEDGLQAQIFVDEANRQAWKHRADAPAAAR